MARPGLESEVIERLREVSLIDKHTGEAILAEGDARFAQSLVSQFDRNGRLSDKQTEWVTRLVERAEDRLTGAKPKAVATADRRQHAVGNPAKLFGLFDTARKNNKPFAVVKFEVAGHVIRLTQAASGKPVNVTDDALVSNSNPDRKLWYGGINAQGFYCETIDTKVKQPEGLIEWLRIFVEDPSKAGRVLGQRQKWCCFCGIKLTSTDSLYYGYGPICAGNFGLEWGMAKEHQYQDNLDAVMDMIAKGVMPTF